MAEIIQINKNTWRLEDGFVRFFLLEGKEKSVLIDSGVGSSDAFELAQTITDKEIILLNTHGDVDHISGTGSFSTIYMHESDYNNCGIGHKYPKTSLIKVEDGDVLDLGNRPLRIVHIPGHTFGSIAILDINERVLYAGDSVQKGHIFLFGNHRAPELYLDSLIKLVSLTSEYDYIYASHDEYKLSNDYSIKVKNAWEKVLSGQAIYEDADLFGNKVKSYTLEDCGFYL